MMITGLMFRDGVISGSNNIANNRQAVDALNIFPVPDGDTGTNMSMTIGAAAKEMAVLPENCTVEEASSRCASALLRGARGNSGVILSLIFRGFSKALRGMEEADGAAVAAAFRKGVDAAYKAVMKPTEGTILTVIRKAAEAAEQIAASGDSMIGVGINSGDLVLIKKQSTAEFGQIVVALVDNETTLKRLKKSKSTNEIYLHPENPDYNDIYLDSDLVIQGVAVKVLKDLL